MNGGAHIGSGRRWLIAGLLLAGLPLTGHAQYGGRRSRYMDDLNSQDYQWTVDPSFQEDVFTFARLRHERGGGFGYGYRRMGWDEDAPRADVILAFRIHEITSLNVRPGFNPIEFNREELARYPFVYLAGVERLELQEQEATVLRNYLLSGGFVMVDNFWGDAAWRNFAAQMKRVFPDRGLTELPIDHPVFHSVYDFKTKPQMPTAGVFENFGVFYDPNYDYHVLSHDAHYFALYDDKGRMMMIVCHNNHFGDGWEHEGDDANYFHVISEGMAYPMFINILVYSMTH